MDYDRCLSASNSRYYDPWYTSAGYSASGTSTMSTYNIRDQHDYPSPAPSDPSPGPRAHQVVDSYPSPNDFTVASFNQIDSSIGPLRSTRRHITIRQSSHNRRLSLPMNGLRENDTSVFMSVFWIITRFTYRILIVLLLR